jgi:enoyl-[acyl-carrier protein] reductase III
MGETSAVRHMFARIGEVFGVLDIFVANAAATAFKPLLEQQEHHLEKTLAITVKSFVLAAQLAAALMQGRQGKIVTVSGVDARRYIRSMGHWLRPKALKSSRRISPASATAVSWSTVSIQAVDTDSAHVFGEEVYRLLAKNIITIRPCNVLACRRYRQGRGLSLF